MKSLFVITVWLLIGSFNLFAQESKLSKHYVGLLPSVLVEPYDTINAVEVNTLPFIYEFRVGQRNDIGLQLRPIANYRFYESNSGISQVGGIIAVNKYFLNVFEDDFWLKPELGAFYMYTYNRLDRINSMTLGIEPGVFMRISNQLSISANLQPGINYYPDQFSKDFVKSESGFKAHFGFIFHIGFNF